MTTTSPSDWLQQLYQSSDVTAQSQAHTAPPPIGGGRVLSDSTVVSTTIHTGGASNDSSPSNINYSFVHLGNLGGGSGSAAGNSISHDSQSSSMSAVATTPTGSAAATGRVSKPARKRTRASRKNPTTLLNTDTKNFRAMVQRFTGGGVGVGTGAGSAATGSGGGAGYNIPAALYSAAGFGLAQGGGLQGQMGNFNQLQQGAGGGSSMMALGMHYPAANPSVGAGVDQFSSLQHHNQLLPTAHQLYTFPTSSTAEISRGGASLRDLDRGIPAEGEVAEINPLLRNVGQVGTAGGGGSDYSSSLGDRGDGGGDTENNSSVRRFMF